MMAGEARDAVGVEELLAEARALLVRMTPAEAAAALRVGALMIDIRPVEQRVRDGHLPGARVISRNVLEWRLDPLCEYRDRELARTDRQLIVICYEGFQSSLVAATARRFELDATDVIGGVQSWRTEGLALMPSTDVDRRSGGLVGGEQVREQ